MLSFSSIGALLLAVAIPVAVGFIGTAVGGGGDSGKCDQACKIITMSLLLTSLYDTDFQVYYDDPNCSFAHSPEFLTLQHPKWREVDWSLEWNW